MEHDISDETKCLYLYVYYERTCECPQSLALCRKVKHEYPQS